MTKYCLKPSVVLNVIENEFIVVDRESGFTATGNKHSFKVLEIMKNPVGIEEIIEKLKK